MTLDARQYEEREAEELRREQATQDRTRFEPARSSLGLDELIRELERIVIEAHPDARSFSASLIVHRLDAKSELAIRSVHVIFFIGSELRSVAMNESQDFRNELRKELTPMWDRIFAGA
jgi:hypothetical protein